MTVSQHPSDEQGPRLKVIDPAPSYLVAALLLFAVLAYSAWVHEATTVAAPSTSGAVISNANSYAGDLATTGIGRPQVDDFSAGPGYVEFELPPISPRDTLGWLPTSTPKRVRHPGNH
jgi:hypothetical protein